MEEDGGVVQSTGKSRHLTHASGKPTVTGRDGGNGRGFQCIRVRWEDRLEVRTSLSFSLDATFV